MHSWWKWFIPCQQSKLIAVWTSTLWMRSENYSHHFLLVYNENKNKLHKIPGEMFLFTSWLKMFTRVYLGILCFRGLWLISPSNLYFICSVSKRGKTCFTEEHRELRFSNVWTYLRTKFCWFSNWYIYSTSECKMFPPIW